MLCVLTHSIDRFSRLPETIPIQVISAETMARAFRTHWIARLGNLKIISTEQGCQFKSYLFSFLGQILRIRHFRTTSYHPAEKDYVKRFRMFPQSNNKMPQPLMLDGKITYCVPPNTFSF